MALRKTWTKKDDALFIQLYPNTPNRELMNIFNCSYLAVKNRSTTLGINKSKEYMNTNKPGCFTKGSVPVNKGQKMPKHVYERCHKTMFKKGQTPHNAKYDNAISVRKDKSGHPYLYIRVASAKWELLHRYLWEKQNGPIPPGHKVVFKDGNSKNVRMENLELVTSKELMERNTYLRYPEELRDLIHTKAVLTRQINKKA